jgi:carboxymethylenebutenolidase
MDQRIIDLYDEYVHVHFDRRLFLERATKLVGSASAAAALLPLLQSNYALAATVAENDPAITTRRVTFAGASGEVKAYLAEPKVGPAKRGSLVVAHQNRGLNPHIEDMARRLAKEGYNALAVDFLSPLGGTPADENVAMTMFAKLDMAKRDGDALAAANWLRGRPESNGKVGAIGWCWGGGAVNLLAVHDPKLNAAVPYYGAIPTPEQIAMIKAPILGNYADPMIDTNLGTKLPGFEAELKKGNKTFTLYTYPGAQHAFNDDTNQERYNKAAADLAWSRTVAFLKQNLS